MARSRKRSRTKSDGKRVLTFVGLGALALATVAAVAVALITAQQQVSPAVAGPRPTFTERPVVPLISVLGDSYTGGSAVGGIGEKNWSGVVKQSLLDSGKDVDMRVDGKGGSGYVHVGGQDTTFVAEVPKVVTPESDVVIFFGSRNDLTATGPEVEAAAASAYAEVKRIAPKAKLIVVGVPWVNEDVPRGAVRTNEAVAAAAKAAGGTFIDPQAERWFFGADAALIGYDKVHPVDEGHIYMAKRITPHVQAALG
ncbi:SGNH/GDSL hydrolase family protein [Paenarthrobacter nicotinovorans]|uniref:SGNH/GDSL hydrolase family protein n=1 Tax=Paenarthrobacter nicotinovorans TaxID=29320 RepID=UPI00382AC724